jgi:repressor LexA
MIGETRFNHDPIVYRCFFVQHLSWKNSGTGGTKVIQVMKHNRRLGQGLRVAIKKETSMLTKKQHQLLMFIDERLRENGISPSFDEMKDALGLKSKSGIHRLVSALQERGFIRRLPHRARALEVLRLPESSAAAPTPPVQAASPLANSLQPQAGNLDPSRDGATVLAFAKPTFAPVNHPATETVMALPLVGRIAAGTPIEALQDSGPSVDVPVAMIGRGEHFCLTIEGDSMVDAGILDGDVVVIRKCQTAENGTIVVALVDGAEATLKRLRRQGETVALEPANRAYDTRYFGPDRVAVQGRLVGLLRHYH